MVSPRTLYLHWKSHNDIRNILATYGWGILQHRAEQPQPSRTGPGLCLLPPGCSSARLSLTRTDSYLYLGGASFTWSLMPTVLMGLWFITPFPRRGGIAKGLLGSIREQQVVPMAPRAKHPSIPSARHRGPFPKPCRSPSSSL